MPKDPELIELRKRKFAREYVKNGFNATNAYQSVAKHIKRSSATVEGSKILRRPNTRDYIIQCMNEEGVDARKVSEKIGQFLSYDPNSNLSYRIIDSGIKHARAILGLDAEKKSHLRVDKQSVKINVDTSLKELDKLITQTKD